MRLSLWGRLATCGRLAIGPALLAACLLVFEAACGNAPPPDNSHGKRVIVLGIDGMDPGFVSQHWADLPNLNRMRHEGSFERLQTTTPPQSPVAWSTFLTGMKPAATGIFDFVERDPDTYLPRSSLGESVTGGFSLPIGPYLLPLTHGHVHTFRKGTPFWKILDQHGIPTTILRMPTNYPPAKTKGYALSGMGTPDLRGTFGEFSFYTDDPNRKAGTVPGGAIIRVQLADGHTVLRVQGPANPLRNDHAPTYVHVDAFVDRTEPVARFDIGDQQLILKQGERSRWIEVHFPLIPVIQSATGMFRIYVKQLHPLFEVYISPVNIDPADPQLTITQPPSYSRRLAKAIGPFYTQGMPFATSAYRQHVFTEAEYVEQSRQVSHQLLKVLHYGVEHLHDGVLFFHFYAVDQNSHMLWGKYDKDLLKTYELVDQTVGWVEKHAPDATIIVMSDHGFTSFQRAVNLNTWLLRQGFLALKPGFTSGGEFFQHVDWSRTKAYAIGLNSLYVNQIDRERYGIVAPGDETKALLKNIRRRLESFRDPLNGKPVVYQAALPFGPGGSPNDSAPDMVVGYYPPYRVSWGTALGATPPKLIINNTDEWRGTHLIAPNFVPGTLITNRPVQMKHPHLYDVTVTLLSQFGIPKPPEMIGHSIFGGRVSTRAGLQPQ